jgi:hypothetical protein
LYAEFAWESEEMALVTKAAARVLLLQEPHPALVLGRHWNVIKTNDAAPRFFGSFVDLAARKRRRNLLHLMFDPAGMRPFIERWGKVAAGLLQRVHRRDGRSCYGCEDNQTLERSQEIPRSALPITFVRGDERLSYFSLITTVGTAQNITAQELRIECMFPMDTNWETNDFRANKPVEKLA